MEKKRRSKLEILKAMNDLIKESDSNSIYKSDFKTKSVDPTTAEEFLQIIQYCQKEIPPVEIMDLGINKKNIFLRKITPKEKFNLKNELFSAINRERTFEDKNYSEKRIKMTFKCDCGFEDIFPEHCGEHMLYDGEKNELTCEICHSSTTIPKHHEKYMKIKIERIKLS